MHVCVGQLTLVIPSSGFVAKNLKVRQEEFINVSIYPQVRLVILSPSSVVLLSQLKIRTMILINVTALERLREAGGTACVAMQT